MTVFRIILVLLLCSPQTSLAQQVGRAKNSATQTRGAGQAPAALAGARHEFEARCSPCHGLDGRGGERAPNIATNPATQQLRDDDLRKIIRDGIPAQGMPGFAYLPNDEIRSLVTYLRYLEGKSGSAALHGNPHRGEELFFGKAECGNCHMMHGKGGFLASDLTEYAQTHGPRDLKEAILHSGPILDRLVETAEIVTRSGEGVSGIVRNEDNFSLQLLGADGAFHNVMKSEIESLRRSTSGVMPSDYARRLSAADLNDLVSYLSQGVNNPSTMRSHPRGE